MSIHEVKKAAELLEKAQAALEQAKKDRAAVNCSARSQDRISVNVNGVYIEITELDRGYCAQVIRGREMIALGAAKLLNEHVARHESNVAKKKAELQECALLLSKSIQ